MRRRIPGSKILLCLTMSLLVVVSLVVLDGLLGQDAYAMGGGGGKNKKNVAQAQALAVTSATEGPSVGASEATSVPEPSTLILIGAGMFGVAFAAYRKKFSKR